MDDWKRLAEVLREIRLAGGEDNRERFARDRGLTNSRTVADLERGKRTDYRATTLRDAERWYGLAPGNIDEILKGGETKRTTTSGVTPEGKGALMQLPYDLAEGMTPAQAKELRVRLEGEGRRLRREILGE